MVSIITPSGKLRAKMTKMRQKLLKIARKLRCFFCTFFRIYSLKIFEGGGLGGAMVPSSPPGYAPAWSSQLMVSVMVDGDCDG